MNFCAHNSSVLIVKYVISDYKGKSLEQTAQVMISLIQLALKWRRELNLLAFLKGPSLEQSS